MESRWDAEWSDAQRAVSVADLAGHDNWRGASLAMQPPGRVLEAGCGLARWVAFLDSQGFEAYGIDYSTVAIERSLSLWPGLRLVQGDFRHLPFDDGFFDGIVSFGAIEHDINGPQAALTEMYRVLRPGGTMFCTVPCMNYVRRCGVMALQDWIVCNRTIRRLTGRRPDVQFFEYLYTPAEYAAILATCGFEVLHLVPTGIYNFHRLGRLRRAAALWLQKHVPWCLAHMVGAVCRKAPGAPGAETAAQGGIVEN